MNFFLTNITIIKEMSEINLLVINDNGEEEDYIQFNTLEEMYDAFGFALFWNEETEEHEIYEGDIPVDHNIELYNNEVYTEYDTDSEDEDEDDEEEDEDDEEEDRVLPEFCNAVDEL